jgi:type VI secretion system protein
LKNKAKIASFSFFKNWIDMALILTVISFKTQALAQPLTATFTEDGGTIGRSESNTLVLPDTERFVSRQHATVSYQNGGYYVTDSSLSGIYLDNQAQALHNSTAQIFDGSRLKIGEYEIAVSIIEDEPEQIFAFSAPPPDTALLPDEDNALFNDNASHNSLLNADEPVIIKHEDLFATDSNPFADSFESQLEQNRSPIFDSYIPPQATKPTGAAEEIPENLSIDDLFADSSTAEKVTVNIEAATPPSTLAVNPEAFTAFLQGAGMTEVNLPPKQVNEAMQRVGKMFRKLVSGTVGLLRSRAEFKSLLRVNMTVIRTANNNPLKFAVSTDDVIKQLLENKAGAFLEATSAVDEGFNDIMNHQLAMQAGIQAALTDLLQHFNPELIEREFQQGLVLQKKSKCWEKYCETYQATAENAVENFFGDAFIKAYETQMKILTVKRSHF